MDIQFTDDAKDNELIKRIVERASNIGSVRGIVSSHDDSQDLAMDISACHSNGCPLDLEKFLAADTFTFMHDVWGILSHMDRAAGSLNNHFLPRCAL